MVKGRLAVVQVNLDRCVRQEVVLGTVGFDSLAFRLRQLTHLAGELSFG